MYFLCCCHWWYCFQLFHQLRVPLPYSSFGTITFLRIHLLILVSGCDSLRITSILPICALPFSITLFMCAPHEPFFYISTPRYVYWFTMGNSSQLTATSSPVMWPRYSRIRPARTPGYTRGLDAPTYVVWRRWWTVRNFL